MNIYELRGQLLTLLASVEEKDHLEKIKLFITRLIEAAKKGETIPDDLTQSQYAELLLALGESDDEAMLVSQENAHKLFSKWKEN